MKKNWKRRRNLGVCALILAALFAGAISGCGGTSSEEETSTGSASSGTNTFVYEDEEAEAPVSTTLYAAVTEMDGSVLTLAVSETSFSGMGGGMNAGGDLPDGADGDVGRADMDSSDGNQPDMSDHDSDEDSSDDSGDGSSDDVSVNSLSTDSSDTGSFTGGSSEDDPPEKPDGEDSEAPDDLPSGGGDMGDLPSGGGDMGEMPSGGGDMGEMPSGGGDMGEMPSGDMEIPEGAGGDMELPDDATDGMNVASFSFQTATLTVGDESVILVEEESDDAAAAEMPDNEADAENADETEDAEETDDAGESAEADASDQYAEGSLSDIEEGSVLEIAFDEDGAITYILVTAQTVDTSMLESFSGSDAEDNNSAGDSENGGSDSNMGGDMGGGNSGSSSSVSYEAVTEYTETTEVDGESYESTGTDENAILIATADAIVTLNNITVSRISSDSTGGDNSSFYGVGAAVLATAGTVYINHAVVSTDASGGAGVFSYGDAVIYVADSTITTEQNTSGGIHVAGGGTLYAWNLTVETSGESAAAIRSDRGGGTMVINGGTYTSNGEGSPALYCTADIVVYGATLVANGSEAFCMEGLNTTYLFDCDITGNMSDLSQNDTTWTFIVYQSMSGDSEEGVSKLQVVGGSVTSENGGLIYTTNTESEILFSDVDITYAEDSEFFLMCTGNANERGWGSTGSNGADCVFTADNQEMEGDVIWDSISTLEFYMLNGSTLTGAFTDDETYAGNGGSGYANVYISSDSAWIVTGDSTVTYLYNAGTITDEDGNTVSIVGTDGTVYVNGTGSYTITVDSYESTSDTVTTFDGALTTESWEDYEIEMPDELS